jgi:tetratricopeptide (TPR) repeat protein
MKKDLDNEVLERNVSTLLEAGGEAPRLGDAARARIRGELVAKFGADASAPRVRSLRAPLVATCAGLAAAAAIALVATRLVGRGGDDHLGTLVPSGTLADGTTYVAEPGATVAVIGPRRVRVTGAALLDVPPGHGAFTVETARGTVEVLGTRFVVTGERERTTAAVVRGEVKLASDGGDVVLHAGEQGIAEPGRAPTRGPAPRLSHLASWAQLARREGDKTVEPLHHGTLFARDPGVRSHPPWGDEYPLPIAKLGVDIVVEDQVARVALDQTFRNDTNQELEGVYRFAIPPDAALQRLAMYVEGKLVESAVVERMQARRIYEELVYRRVDPALLEWAGTGRLNLRVYPLHAHQDKRLALAYTQSLPKLYDDWTLSVPLPEIDQPVGELAVAMRVKGCASCEIRSTSHSIEVTQDRDDAVVSYRAARATIGDSLVIHVRDPRKQATVARHVDGDDRYVMVRSPIELGGAPAPYRARTWVLLDDVSASRGAMELRAQAELVDSFLRELDENDRVAVVAFDVQARVKLAPTRVIDVDRAALHRALDGEGGVGATDFAVGLDAALAQLGGAAQDDATIVYIGDGVITSGPRHLDELRAKLAGKARFVGVGVGDGADTQTLDALAGATGGYATTMDLADDLRWRAFDLVAALHTARATGVSARLVDGNGRAVPATLYLRSPQLADGEELELVAKVSGDGAPAAVELDGSLAGTPWHRRVELPQTSKDGGYLPRLWAQRHIAARLLAKHEPVAAPACPQRSHQTCPTEAQAREARDEAIRQEIVALGKRYFLLSRHTSLLVLENDEMYAKFGVAKGSGDTWARYAMPATIPVAVRPTSQAPLADVAADAALVRTPLQLFYDYAAYYGQAALRQQAFEQARTAGILGSTSNVQGGAFASLTPTSGTTGYFVDGGVISRRDAFAAREQQDVDLHAGLAGTDRDRSRGSGSAASVDTSAPAGQPVTAVTTSELGGAGDTWMGFDDGKLGKATGRYHAIGHGSGTGYGVGKGGGGNGWADAHRGATRNPYAYGYGVQITPLHLVYPTDPTFDDVTGFVPALSADAFDFTRAALDGTPGPHAIDDAARALLASARAALPVGIYRWGSFEIAIDGDRRVGWRRTTPTGLVETASYDGAAWTRRYAELGLDVARAVGDDDVALALAYLPLWIAEPAHYARWFDVRAKSAHEVALARADRGKSRTIFVLRFDDRSHLVAIGDGDGRTLVSITWGTNGPIAARVLDDDVAAGFTGTAVGDAPAWAHGDTRPGVTVELPNHLVAYWRARVAAESVGTPAWRRAQRQLMASLAAMQDRGGIAVAFGALAAHGGVELGDLALASGALQQLSDADAARIVADRSPLARYLADARALAKAQREWPAPDHTQPGAGDGLLGGLRALRAIAAHAARNDLRVAVSELEAMNGRAPELALVGAAAIGQHWDGSDVLIARAWDVVATGEYRNMVRAQAAMALYQRGRYDAAAERIVALVDDLDPRALPPHLEIAPYAFQNSRRGAAGWQIVYGRWRDRVLAAGTYEHVLAMLPVAAQRPGDLPALLARAAELAGDDVERQVAIIQIATQYGQSGFAQSLLDPLLKAHPSRDLYQLRGSAELGQGRLADALADLEAAQDAGKDERVDINVVRGELGQILGVAQQLAVQSRGTARDHAIARALVWGARWRALDPGNAQIDARLGELMLATGDTAGAWRQLSSMIERDPWSSVGYMTVAETYERQGKVVEALAYWQQAIVIDQTNPTPLLRKAQALIALGRDAEGDALLRDIATPDHPWHDVWSGVVYQAKAMLEQSKQRR